MSARPPPDAEMLRVLRERFGLQQFRGCQAEVIRRILAGRDVFALMPTGAGKSLCYQLPALLLDGVTVVVSPLIALMRDQERRLQALGIAARALSSAQSPGERANVEEELRQGRLRVLLLSPERLLAPGFLPGLERLCRSSAVRLLVIDEAHCVAEWGREFRPVYRRLGELRRWFPGVPLLALTASADQAVQAEITTVLGIAPEAVLHAGFDRPELFYRVARTSAPARCALAYLQAHHPATSAIFYCRRRWQTVVLARFLREHGVAARAYHAGLAADIRSQHEQWFLQAPVAVMAATIAFGMGIDKPDVRLVVHLGAAASLAAYYQESGRAGRDGQSADALLLLPLRPESSQEDVADGAMAAFAAAAQCRRAALLAAFGESCQTPCSGCDRCQPDWHPVPDLRHHTLPWVPCAIRRVPRAGLEPA